MDILQTIANRVDSFFRVSDEHAGDYLKLSGAWYAVGGFCVEQAFNQVDHGIDGSNIKTFAAEIALSGVTFGAGAFFQKRGQRSVGEFDG